MITLKRSFPGGVSRMPLLFFVSLTQGRFSVPYISAHYSYSSLLNSEITVRRTRSAMFPIFLLFARRFSPHTGKMPLFFLLALLLTPITELCAFPPNTADLPAVRPTVKIAPAAALVPVKPVATATAVGGVLPKKVTFELGITHLRISGFDILQGKRIGLLTHAAAVDERGVSSIDILKNAPGVKLTALYAPEHGLNGQTKAEEKIENETYEGIPV